MTDALIPWVYAAALAGALLLDRLAGEPPARWHPVRWIGVWLGWVGARIAPRTARPQPDRVSLVAGALAWYAGAALALVLQALAFALPAPAAALLLAVLLKPLFAWRMLEDEVAAVEAAQSRGIAAARTQVARLVSRPVVRLTPSQVRAAALSSLAENANDSMASALLWLCLAGLPGAALYRYANTADAMWGYRGWRGGLDWTAAGHWAARADDCLSWPGARLTALALALAAGPRQWPALRGLTAQARLTPSPNGGWPMAALALLLGCRLEKPGVYVINARAPDPQPMHTVRALVLVRRALVLLAAAALALLALGPLPGTLWR